MGPVERMVRAHLLQLFVFRSAYFNLLLFGARHKRLQSLGVDHASPIITIVLNSMNNIVACTHSYSAVKSRVIRSIGSGNR